MAAGARKRILDNTPSALTPPPRHVNVMRDKCQGRKLHCAHPNGVGQQAVCHSVVISLPKTVSVVIL